MSASPASVPPDQWQERPPRLAAWLVARRVPPDQREFVLGDLHEAFVVRCGSAHGVVGPRLWYCRQAVSIFFAQWPRLRAWQPPHRGDSNVSTLLTDLRLSLRALRRSPLFSVLVVITFAIGIGAATSLFSVIRPVLLQSPPYPAADRLILISERGRDGTNDGIGWLTFADLARDSRSLATAAAMAQWQPTLRGTDDAERLSGQRVSHTFFATLGVRPLLGRDFTAEEDFQATRTVAILSYALWQRRFGGDRTIVNRSVEISGRKYTVVGVLPPTFESLLAPGSEIWSPLGYEPSYSPACRTCHHLTVIARLRDGVSESTARHELDALILRYRAAYADQYATVGSFVTPLATFVSGSVKPALLAMTGAVALLLLIACANVANLVVGRTIERQGEWAVRTALGAQTRRLVTQVSVESTVLALIGGAGGILLAWLGVKVLPSLATTPLPRADQIAVSSPAMLFALGASLACALLAGMLPALLVLRSTIAQVIRDGARHLVGSGRHRLRGGLVVAEVALALMLLVGSGLLLRSLDRALRVDTGFQSRGVSTMALQLSGPRYNDDVPTFAFFRAAMDSARAIPGVRSAAVTSQLPLGGNFDSYGIHWEDRPSANPEEDRSAQRFAVGTEYLQTMGIRVLHGRGFTATDRVDSPPVVLVNQKMADSYFAGVDPIGRRVKMGGTDGPWRTIVGIVANARHLGLEREQEFQIYLPFDQNPFSEGGMTLVVRSDWSPGALVPSLERAIRAIDPGIAISNVQPMDAVVQQATASRRFTLSLLGLFAFIALLLSSTGLYGVLSASVIERTREIGLRAALGAPRQRILVLVVRQGLTLTAIGLAIGASGALALSGTLRSFLFGVGPTDPVTFAGVAVTLGVIAVLACWVPAWRASRVDPAIALRAP